MESTLARSKTKTDWLFSQIERCAHTRQLGWLGEQIISALIPSERFIVYKPRKSQVGDLHVTDKQTGVFLKVEVKTARMNARQMFEFKLRKHDKHGVTDISHADIVLCFCIHPSGLYWFYIIPVAALGPKQTSLTIPATTTHEGRYAPYLLTSLKRLPERIQ